MPLHLLTSYDTLGYTRNGMWENEVHPNLSLDDTDMASTASTAGYNNSVVRYSWSNSASCLLDCVKFDVCFGCPWGG